MFKHCHWGVALLLGAQALSTSAAEVQTSANVYTGLTYTSNIALAPSGLEEDEIVWQLSPSFGATVTGKRFNLNANYTLQSLLFLEEDDRNRVNNFLNASLQSELSPDFLYFDANAAITQNIVDAQNGAGFSSINAGNNLAETITAQVSPYVRRKLGAFTEFRAGFNAGIVEYDDARLFDTQQNGTFASINNVDGAGSFNWKLDYNSTSVEYDIGQEIELTRFGAELGYRLSPRMEFVVSGGEESNSFGLLPGNGAADGSYWDVGLRGSLSNTTTYDVRVGEQFFGDSYSVGLTRQSRDLTTQISYNERATTSGAQQLNFDNLLGGLQRINPSLLNTDISGLDLPQVNPELYVRKRLDAGATYSRSKSVWNLRGYYEDRSFIRTLVGGEKENVLGASASWTWNFDQSTTIATRFNVRRLDARDGVSQPEEYRLGVSASRNILAASYVQFDIWTDHRAATGPRNEFKDNGASLGFGRRF